MGKEDFDLLMNEIDTISEKVSSFPRNMQEMVYRHIVGTLLDESAKLADPVPKRRSFSQSVGFSSVGSGGSSIQLNKKQIRSYYLDYDLRSINDMEFAAFCAYYLSELASPDTRSSAIDDRTLVRFFEIVGRDTPGNPRSTLNNARRVRKYLEPKERGMYGISAGGWKYVNGLLNKEGQQ